MLNLHHLELFYYVARHRGIAGAVRHMPYGIQQPAVSGQILTLEDHLGVTLFRRRPFELTAAGRDLFAVLEPFFSGLDDLERRLQREASARLRLGASQTVLKDHLPAIARALREQFPNLQLVLRTGYQHHLESLLEAGEIDLAVTVIDRSIATGLRSEILIELELALLVPPRHPARNADRILAADRLSEPLVGMPAEEAGPRVFHRELERRGLAWPVTLEVGTLELVATYVAAGFGVGLGIRIPGVPPPPGVRVLPLDDFPRIPVGLLWIGKLSRVTRTLADRLRAAARSLIDPPSPPSSPVATR
ncbi:MAG: LysR family transcriptional regulator [Verrucomicrobiae bacterium]|nr:LysR family transcriptional regulator [Verrucomicrobiae bacterium]